MDISLLTREVPEVEKPGLEIFDPRFDDIAGSAQNGKYEEAAAQVEALLQEGIYDVRLIGYFAYGVFLEGGIGVVAELSNALRSLVSEYFDRMGPVNKREKQAQVGFRWFLAQLLKKVEYEEKRESPAWNEWVRTITSDQVGEAIEALGDLRKALGAALAEESDPVLELLPKINAWLEQLQRLVYKEPEPEPATPGPEPQQDMPAAAPSPVPGAAPIAGNTGVFVSAGMSLPCSSKMHELTRKLEAFEKLVSEGHMTKAAVVSDDIKRILANFRPQEYFPKLFSGYFSAIAENISELSELWQMAGSAEWDALRDFYDVDLESFAGMPEPEFDPSQVSMPAAGAKIADDFETEGEADYDDQDDSFEDDDLDDESPDDEEDFGSDEDLESFLGLE